MQTRQKELRNTHESNFAGSVRSESSKLFCSRRASSFFLKVWCVEGFTLLYLQGSGLWHVGASRSEGQDRHVGSQVSRDPSSNTRSTLTCSKGDLEKLPGSLCNFAHRHQACSHVRLSHAQQMYYGKQKLKSVRRRSPGIGIDTWTRRSIHTDSILAPK